MINLRLPSKKITLLKDKNIWNDEEKSYSLLAYLSYSSLVLEQRLQDSLLYIFNHTRSIKLEDVAYPSADEGIQTPDHNVKAKSRSITVAKSSRWKCLWICSLFLNVSASNAVSNTIFPWELERAQKASACMKRWARVPIRCQVVMWVIFVVG